MKTIYVVCYIEHFYGTEWRPIVAFKKRKEANEYIDRQSDYELYRIEVITLM